MNRPRLTLASSSSSALCVAVVLTGALSGCAAYLKCGYAGCPGDAEITSEVVELIQQHPALDAPNSVRVHTTDHVVYLYGEVNTEVERSEAETLARQVADVRKVVDSINFSFQGR
jgi:osmotically-inducible protein OsmY